MSREEFLESFATKFGKSEEEKEAIKSSNYFYIDYYDGIFCFYKDDGITYRGGNNGNIFECEDYQYFWAYIKGSQEDFNLWMNKHHITEDDLMVVTGKYLDRGEIGSSEMEITCSFCFYQKI